MLAVMQSLGAVSRGYLDTKMQLLAPAKVVSARKTRRGGVQYAQTVHGVVGGVELAVKLRLPDWTLQFLPYREQQSGVVHR